MKNSCCESFNIIFEARCCTDEQHLSDKPALIHVEKHTVPGSSTLPEIVLLQAFDS